MIYLSILFLNILTLLACTQSVDNLFHTLMVLWKNEYFLTSNLLCSFTSVKLCPLIVLLPLLLKSNIIINIGNQTHQLISFIVNKNGDDHCNHAYGFISTISHHILFSPRHVARLAHRITVICAQLRVIRTRKLLDMSHDTFT